MNWKTGETYKGELSKGIMQGRGVYKKEGIIYDGEFVKGQLMGDAIITDAEENVYKGEVINGVKEGKGVINYGQNHEFQSYAGEFNEDLFHGKGKLLYKCGHSYVGEFKNGEFHGQGTLKKGPETYIGGFSGGLYSGPGNWSYGLAFYHGGWHEGRADGKGQCKDWDGENYSGMFSDGKPLGRHRLQDEFVEALTRIL